MLALCRNIAKGDRLLHRGLWVKDGGRQLTGKTVGIIGCGHIGTEVGKILKAFQCPLQLCDIIDLTQKAEQLSAKVVTLDQLLQESDFISLHVPLTPETLNLIGEAQLQLMKPTSYLINTSRGKVVDQHALKIALISGQIAGAGLDVFSKEPLVDPELYQLENLVLTPHSAGNSAEAVLAMGEAAIRGIQSLIVACKKELV
jgi:D-3-phosphoglycerate dehydrogenase